MIAFHDEITGSADKGKAVCVIYLDFSKALDTVSHSTLADMLNGCGQEGQTSRRGKNWLDHCTRSIGDNSSESNRHMIKNDSQHFSVQGLILPNTFGMGSSCYEHQTTGSSWYTGGEAGDFDRWTKSWTREGKQRQRQSPELGMTLTPGNSKTESDWLEISSAKWHGGQKIEHGAAVHPNGSKE